MFRCDNFLTTVGGTYLLKSLFLLYILTKFFYIYMDELLSINILNYIFLLTLYVQKQNPRANTHTHIYIYTQKHTCDTTNKQRQFHVRWTCIALRELYISSSFTLLPFNLQDLQRKRLFI